MTHVFPSVGWFQALADRMAAQPDKYRRLGPMELTLVPRIVFPDGRAEEYSLSFDGHRCRGVERLERPGELRAAHPVVLEGDYASWCEMIDNIHEHGRADLEHTLNYLTLRDWPFRLAPLDQDGGQLDVDRFYRYNETLQQLFDDSSAVDTRFVGNGNGR